MKKNETNHRSDTARSLGELASDLGIALRQLKGIKDHFPDAPKGNRQGRQSISAWRDFIKAKGIDAEMLEVLPSVPNEISAMKARLAEQQVVKLQLANELTRRQQIALTELQAKLPPFLMALRTGMDQCIPELATSLEGIDDHSEREEIIQEQFNKVFSMLTACPWLDEVPLEMDGE
jgi:hypothetical protein